MTHNQITVDVKLKRVNQLVQRNANRRAQRERGFMTLAGTFVCDAVAAPSDTGSIVHDES